MPDKSYLYSVADFPQGFDLSRCEKDIADSAISTALSAVLGYGQTIELIFKAELSSTDKEALDGSSSQTEQHPPLPGSLLGEHSGEPYLVPQIVDISAAKTSDGRLRTAVEKSEGERLISITHRWNDPTTWYSLSVRRSSQAATEIGEATIPPSSPSEEDASFVGVGATGAWSGKDGLLTAFQGGSWKFFAPPSSWSFAGRKAYKLPHRNVIDTFHGLLSDEDLLLHPSDQGSLRLSVSVSSSPVVEDDPHFAERNGGFDPDGDFLCLYRAGILCFKEALSEGATVEASYCSAGESRFTLKPDSSSKRLKLSSVEVQFSNDIRLCDTVVFQVWANLSKVAPLLVGLPASFVASTLKVPLWKSGSEAVVANEMVPVSPPKKYKTMNNYQDECTASFPKYEALGAGNWRGNSFDVIIFHWEYTRDIDISGALEAEIRVWLEHEESFEGSYATATFYGAIESL